jgi:type IV secretory pathway VirB2 component (pilin)
MFVTEHGSVANRSRRPRLAIVAPMTLVPLSRACDAGHHRGVTDMHRPRVTDSTLSRLPVRLCVLAAGTLLMLPALALAQSPWERAAANLEISFTGPLARSLALVAIVLGGLMFMYGEGGAKRQIAGVVFGGGLALFAVQFLTWLFA